MTQPKGPLRNCATSKPWDGSGYLVPRPSIVGLPGSASALDCFNDGHGNHWERVHNLATARYFKQKGEN